MTNNDELAQKLKSAADKSVDNFDPKMFILTRDMVALLAERDADKKRIAELEDTLERECEKSRRMASRIAELEARTVSVKLPDDEDGQPFGFGKWANSKLPATTGTMTISRCEDSWRAALYVFAAAAGIKLEVGE